MNFRMFWGRSLGSFALQPPHAMNKKHKTQNAIGTVAGTARKAVGKTLAAFRLAFMGYRKHIFQVHVGYMINKFGMPKAPNWSQIHVVTPNWAQIGFELTLDQPWIEFKSPLLTSNATWINTKSVDRVIKLWWYCDMTVRLSSEMLMWRFCAMIR